jgi:hypothetical protein
MGKTVFTTDEKDQYINQKLKDLREFGYPSLTREEVAEQLEKALNGEKLNVVGMMIKSDIARGKNATV